MKKIIRIGKSRPSWTKKSFNIFCSIEFTDGCLSISGVEGPLPSGNCRGACGQINMSFNLTDIISYAPGMSRKLTKHFLSIWSRYHLNDMKAGCEHQRAEHWGEDLIPELNKLSSWVYEKEHPKGVLSKPCPICGYHYGSAWLKEEVPQDVIDFLFSLPSTDIEPAWI